ncbi:MAG: aminopeptidase N [Planktomarina sp.]
MHDASPQTIYLNDYRAPAYWVDDVQLTFKLHPTGTRVMSRVSFRPNIDAHGPFFLNGEHMTLITANIDGVKVTPTVTDEGLTCAVPDTPFIWEAEVEISPETNTALEGLYMSNGMYCTQCEAEGFRRITYYPDRPDVMAPFKVRVESDLPVLLSNGNPAESGDGWAEWNDPWPKPAYLFALVAGDLIAHPDQFTTKSGTDVELNIYVRDGDQDKCDFAMKALKASMKWDQDVYGREYDLDVFNIVAVDDFNMGAMENKGLNIFNSSAVLASPETATDANFERIEAIIAHEYFHNWTGNRITCRDWFQLCLKEGLTVFRDQQFSADARSAPVRRIEDVLALRGRQFREDGGPLAHAVRPESFVEINNFYTATVYEKGAEVIGMLKRLVGDAAYSAALDLYFDRHDGQACTIEDWFAVFEDSTGRDLSQFKTWYSQAGTPKLSYEEGYEGTTYSLTLMQETPPTPGQDVKEPLLMPIAVGLLDQAGNDLIGTQVLELSAASQTFTFKNIAEKPTLSILRGFSAPVILTTPPSATDRLFLLANDTDAFNRWDAGRSLGRQVVEQMITHNTPVPEAYLAALVKLAADTTLDPAFRALCLTAPGQDDIAQTIKDAGHTPDPVQIWLAVETMRYQLAQHMQDALPALYAANQVEGPYSPDAKDCGKRALGNLALGLLSKLDGGAQAQKQFEAANNMTQQLSALACLVSADKGADALQTFYDQWSHERLVIDKWFGIQVSRCSPIDAASIAAKLTQHKDFTLKNPNRFRALFGALAMTPAAFHDANGASYTLLTDNLIALDKLNPQLAARMITVFESWKRYDKDRQAMITGNLKRLQSQPDLSRNTKEMVDRILG